MRQKQTILSPILEWPGFDEVKLNMKPDGGTVRITGCVRSQKTHLAMALGDDKRTVVIVVSNDEDADAMRREIEAADGKALCFPAPDYLFYKADARSDHISRRRAETLAALAFDEQNGEKPLYVLTTMNALLGTVASKDRVRGYRSQIRAGQEISPRSLIRKAAAAGYTRVPLVETRGEYAARGGIVDIWPLRSEEPCRLEWWGDQIDTIRWFDPQSQRSGGSPDILTIEPLEVSEPDGSGSLLDWFDPSEDIVILNEPSGLFEEAGRVVEEIEAYKQSDDYGESGAQAPDLYTPDQVANTILSYPSAAFFTLAGASVKELKTAASYSIESRIISGYNKSFEMLVRDLRRIKRDGGRTVLLSPSATRARRIAADLRDYDLQAYFDDDRTRTVRPGEIFVTTGFVENGYAYPEFGWHLIAESDIFGRSEKKRRRARKGKALDFSELTSGDYVIHENHGLGIYRGIEKIEADGVVKDYVKISYADKASLYVPAGNLDLIQKYSGGEGKRPRLNKLGSNEWTTTKSRVRKAIELVAEDLVKLYAERSHLTGFPFSADSPWQREFEDFFPYEETEDQLNAISDVKKDMESTSIMDRLICGDVGYGKTEVALRAAFKAVQDSKQVAVLVPTTVLAQQHYNTFCQRFSHFPVRIALLSRFTTPAEQKKIIGQVAAGQVDIVIGTHRLLSKDIEFKDLGLLVVDEEQRFGVQAKEKIKKWKMHVDVITMTATPIPRTLHMSLIGIRDMSVLEEPPADRMPVQTYVMEYDPALIKEAIRRELARGGQVYYVHNRARDLADIAAMLKVALPDAEIAYAHGKMPENRLEQIMVDFVDGRIDILVTTTIIETGLDIPNVNTLIVRDADRFGLSQLYQLRGRVGRSGRSAYAFLTYRKDKELSTEASKRLSAIRQFTELGSGIHIAMRDLQIRGAGNMLGEAQSGHMAAIGYDLYCRMLSEAVHSLKDGDRPHETFTTTVDLDVDAHIPPSYIPDESQRLDIYRRIAALSSEEEKEDLIDELIDRYGELPKSAEPLFEVASLKILAHEADITLIEQKQYELRFVMHEHARTDPRQIPALLKPYRGNLTFKTENPPFFLYFRKNRSLTDCDQTVLELAREIAGRIREAIPEETVDLQE